MHRQDPWDAEERATLREMWDLGNTLTEIEAKLDRSREAIMTQRRNMGLKPRPPATRHKAIQGGRSSAVSTLPPLASLQDD